MTAILQRFRSSTGKALIATLIGSGAGFLLPFCVAWKIGAGRVTDAYFFALGLALFGSALCNIVIESNALPIMQQAFKQGVGSLRLTAARIRRQAVIGAMAGYLPVVLIGSAVVLLRDWPQEIQIATILITCILMAMVAAIAVNSVSAAVLYAHGDFLTPRLTEVCRALLPLICLPFLGTGVYAVEALAVLMVIGESLRTVVLLGRIRHHQPGHDAGGTALEGSLWTTAGPHAVAVLVANLAPVTDRIVASALVAGSITVIDLGEKVLFVPLTALMFSVILIPGARWARMSDLHHDKRLTDLKRVLIRVGWLSVVCAVVMVGGALLISLEAGSTFVGVPTHTFTLVMICLAFGLPGGGLTATASRFLTATQQTKFFPLFAVVIFTVNIVSDVVGAHWFGVVGIAAATSVVRCVNALLYLLVCFRAAPALARVGMRATGQSIQVEDL